MTIVEVLRIVQHYARHIIVVGIASMLVIGGAGCLLSLGKGYSTTATLTSSDPIGTISAGELIPIVRSIATKTAQDHSTQKDSEDQSSYTEVTATNTLSDREITFDVIAPTKEESTDLALECAEQTAEEAAQIFSELADDYRNDFSIVDPERPENETSEIERAILANLSGKDKAASLGSIVFYVNEADDPPSNILVSNTLKFSLVGLFLGLVVSILCFVFKASMRKPILDSDTVENNFGLRILNNAENIADYTCARANIAFAAKKHHVACQGEICLLPVGRPKTTSRAHSFAASLVGPDQYFSGEISLCQPIGFSIDGVVRASESLGAVLLVEEWSNTLKDLKDAVSELELAQVKILGAIYIPSRETRAKD